MLHSIGNVFKHIGDWLASRSEIGAMDRETVRELAHDIGVTPADLYRLDRNGSSDISLLNERLYEEGVNSATLQAKWPSVWKDLERTCALCESKDECQQDLAVDPDAQEWHRYCPNSGTIETLR